MRKFLGVARGPFLLLVPACLAPAFAVAWSDVGFLSPLYLVLIVAAALASHVAVNALNEYDDFRTGLDFTTEKTPFSGGSGTLIAHPDFAPATLLIGWLGVLATAAIGLFFLVKVGTGLLVPGVLGLVIVVAYNHWINRLPLLCLIAPGLGFGLLMVNLSVLVLTGSVSALSVWISIPVTLLVSNLLLVNQLPDIEADEQAGRRHLAIAWGDRVATRVSVALLAGCYLVIVVSWLLGSAPVGTLMGLLTLPVALGVARKVLNFEPGKIDALVPAMGMNVVVTLVTPLLMAAGMLMFP